MSSSSPHPLPHPATHPPPNPPHPSPKQASLKRRSPVLRNSKNLQESTRPNTNVCGTLPTCLPSLSQHLWYAYDYTAGQVMLSLCSSFSVASEPREKWIMTFLIGLGFRVQGLGLLGLGFRVRGSGFRV